VLYSPPVGTAKGGSEVLISVEEHSEALRLLSEIGYAAAQHGLGRQAEPVFRALELCRPKSAAAGVGRALVALNRGQAEEAVRVLRQEALRAEPDSRSARALLGLALRLAGLSHESRQVLEALVADDGEDNSARMAREILAVRS
jgi:thioredoxin-like negative regulator of GroEL